MAGNAIIGALRVVLGADTAALEKGLKSAQSTLGAFGVSAAKSAAIAAAAITTATAGIGVALKGAINDADKMGKAAQKIGLPVEELSALKYAADLSGVSFESLQTSVGRLSKTMVEAAAKPASEAANAFRALGISATDSGGKIKPTGLVLSEIAGKFEGLKDGAGKTAVAMALFGRAGADLIPLLNAGKVGLAGMIQEARDLGIVIDEKTKKAAEGFNDNLTRLSAVVSGVLVQAMAGIAPILQGLSQRFVDAAKQGGLVKDTASILARAFEGVARAALLVADNIKPILTLGALFVGSSMAAAAIRMGIAFVKLAAAVKATGIVLGLFELIRGASLRGILFMGAAVALVAGKFDDFKEVLGSLADKIAAVLPKEVTEGTKKLLEGMGLKLDALEADLSKFGATASGAAAKGLKDLNYNALGGANALDKFIEAKSKTLAGLEAELPLIGQSNILQERAKIIAEGLAVALANKIPITAELRQKLEDFATTFARVNEVAAFGKQIFEQTRTPLEQYQQTMEKLNATGFQWTRPDLYARAVAQAQEKMTQADPVAQALGSSLTSAFDRAIQGAGKLSDVLKSLLTDLTRALANTAFKQLLFGNSSQGGTSGGLIGALANGLRGYATGGSFAVGGAGGIDSQLVAFRATPGERVTVDHGAGPAGGVSISYAPSYNVQGSGPEIAALRAEIARDRAEAPQRIVRAVQDAQSRRVLKS